MNALHEQFIAEARELIQQATDDLIAVEREGFVAPSGSIGFFVLFTRSRAPPGWSICRRWVVTLHAAEDLLAALHAGQARGQPGDHRPGARLPRSGCAMG